MNHEIRIPEPYPNQDDPMESRYKVGWVFIGVVRFMFPFYGGETKHHL